MKKLVILMYGITSELFTRTIAECCRYNSFSNVGYKHHGYEGKNEDFGDQTDKVHSLKHASLTLTSYDGMPL
jgi:hypothetical protein